MNQPPSRRTTFVCGLLAVAMGLFILLQGLGVVPVKGSPANGALWIGIVAGLIFMGAGISIAVGAIHGVSATGEVPKDSSWWMRLFYYLIGLVVVGGLAATGSWVAFGPGARSFSGPGLFLLSAENAALVGRIIFGFGAVLTWLCLIALVASGARKLFPDRTET